MPYTGATDDLNLGSKAFTTTGASTLGTVSTTSTSGAQVTSKYNSTNYATLTTASNGDLTIATVSSTTGGNINLSSAITGDFTLLSNSGTLVLGGTSLTNNENLKFDFETSSNRVAVTSGTGATDIDLGSINLTSTGVITLGGSTTGTLVTRVKTGAASESDANGSLVIDSTNGRLYFRYGSAWHYVAQTAGFQIPDFETIDPISGDEIKEGDIVLGMVNQTFEDKALHGVWVKWDSVKDKLLEDIQTAGGISPNGSIGDGLASAGSSAGIETFLQKVTNALFSLGITIKNGITSIKELKVAKSDTDIARIKKIEMVDSETGDIYCSWIKNGEWQKAKGECGSVQVAITDTTFEQEASEAVKQAANQAASQAATQAAEQAGQQVVQEVRNNIKNEIESQVQAQVQEEVKEQLEKEPREPANNDSAKQDLPGDNLLEILVPQNVQSENPQESAVSEPPVSEPDTSESAASEPVANEEPPAAALPQEETVAPVIDGAVIENAASALANKMGIIVQPVFALAINGFDATQALIINTTQSLSQSNEKISAQIVWAMLDMGAMTQKAFPILSDGFDTIEALVMVDTQGFAKMGNTIYLGLVQLNTGIIVVTDNIKQSSKELVAQLPILTDTAQMLKAVVVGGAHNIKELVVTETFKNNNKIVSELAQKSTAEILKANFNFWETAVNTTLYVQGKIKTSTAGLINSMLNKK